MIHLTIDGIPVEVEKGTTILQAARQIGVEIPTLCYLEDVLPYQIWFFHCLLLLPRTNDRNHPAIHLPDSRV